MNYEPSTENRVWVNAYISMTLPSNVTREDAESLLKHKLQLFAFKNQDLDIKLIVDPYIPNSEESRNIL